MVDYPEYHNSDIILLAVLITDFIKIQLFNNLFMIKCFHIRKLLINYVAEISSLLKVSSPVRRHVYLVMLVSYWVLNLTSIKTKSVTHPQKIEANEIKRVQLMH